MIGQDSWDRKQKTGAPWQDTITEQSGHDSKDRTAWAGQLQQVSLDRSVGKGPLGQVSLDRTERRG